MMITTKKTADWTEEEIAVFWDWQSKNMPKEVQYFTAVMAPGIARFLKNKGLLKGNVLDYGCGSGHLLEQMALCNDASFYGLDFSEASVTATQLKTANNKNVKEVIAINALPSSFANETFDTITLIETIEHLQDKMLHDTMNELHRLLKPGGIIFITTPFNEALDQHLQFCPFCKTAFHHMQHMQSFDVAKLTALAKQHHFSVVDCSNINIEKLKLGTVKYAVKKMLKSLLTVAGLIEKQHEKTPNLVAMLSK